MTKSKIISYDFDGVLHKSVSGVHPYDMLDYESWEPFYEMHDQLRRDSVGATIVVVTARTSLHLVKNAVNRFIEMYELPVSEVYYTDNKPKRHLLESIGAVKHYDDNPRMLQEMRGSSCEFVLVKPK
jgi:hypothetical protein